LNSEGIKKALIISVSDYQDETLENLESCKNDGEEMFKVLTNLGYEIPSERKLVGKVNYQDMKEAIIQFFRHGSVKPQDTLLFYFSGHGLLDGYGGRFFANTQTGTSIPEEYGLPFNFLTEQMQKTNSDKTVAILDCCFSGGAALDVVNKFSGVKGEEESEKLGREALEKQFAQSQGTCVLASSLSNRLSYMLPDKPFSAFTYYVLEGLKGHEDAIDNEGCVTPTLLSQFIFSKLSQIKGITQKPIRNISVAGKIILAQHSKPKIKTGSSLNLGKEKIPIKNEYTTKSNILKNRKTLSITIIVALVGITLISSLIYQQNFVTSGSSFIVSECGPQDYDGQTLSSLKVNQMVPIYCDLAHDQPIDQKFRIDMKIINEKNEVVLSDESWPIIQPGKPYTIGQSWEPSTTGKFNIIWSVGELPNDLNNSEIEWNVEINVEESPSYMYDKTKPVWRGNKIFSYLP